MRTSISVLVTGSSGRIGRAAVAELQRRGHSVRGFDLTPTPGLADCVAGDLTDRAALDRVMDGIQCVVHLAATPDDADFLTELLPNNIVGLYHIMESARAAGVGRIILASSGQVNWWQQRTGPFPIRPEDPISPRYWYAATKMFMEAIGRSYSEVHGMSVIIARLGWCPRTPEQVDEIAATELFRDLYFSPGDAGRFFGCAVEAPAELRHAVIYGASRPRVQPRLDMTSAAELLGYEPQETWPEGVEIVTGSPYPAA
jgi:nucleoside-diphosphate-sugar epimerase